jgi:hypothetical protein
MHKPFSFVVVLGIVLLAANDFAYGNSYLWVITNYA